MRTLIEPYRRANEMPESPLTLSGGFLGIPEGVTRQSVGIRARIALVFVPRRGALPPAHAAPSRDTHTEDPFMSIGRATKIAAGILFILAVVGVTTPVSLVPLGLAVWVLGEAA
jgi:hypothetical protein